MPSCLCTGDPAPPNTAGRSGSCWQGSASGFPCFPGGTGWNDYYQKITNSKHRPGMLMMSDTFDNFTTYGVRHGGVFNAVCFDGRMKTVYYRVVPSSYSYFDQVKFLNEKFY